jgi:leucyl-tRNA synthetase
MELTNWWQDHPNEVAQSETIDFLKLLFPFAPHMTEELYHANVVRYQSGKDFHSIHTETWPEFDKELVKEESVTLVIQVNGKVRDQIVVSAHKSNVEEHIKQLALSSAKTQKWLGDRKINRTIFVPGKLINFVV